MTTIVVTSRQVTHILLGAVCLIAVCAAIGIALGYWATQ
jgi:hypothetical protein